MKQRLGLVTLVVRDYDEAIRFFTDALGFELAEDQPVPEQDKRWVVVTPKGCDGTGLLLARATTDAQASAVGNQTGGRVGFFLHTDDFDRDHAAMQAKGVQFRESPRIESYGKVAVFEDLYGNTWDLLQPSHPEAK